MSAKTYFGMLSFVLLFAATAVETLAITCSTISSSGSYTLDGNTSSVGTCIQINADDVEFDCQGFTIKYANTSATGYAVNATARNRIIVKNCRAVLNGTSPDSYGIVFSGTNHSQIIDSYADSTGALSAAGVRVQNSFNDTVRNTTGIGTGDGIQLATTRNVTVVNSTGIATGTKIGISFTASFNGTVINSTGTGGTGPGISATGSRDMLFENSIGRSNTSSGINTATTFSMTMRNVAGSTLTGNGITFQTSNNSLILNCNATSNSSNGMSISTVRNSTISHCYASSNTGTALSLVGVGNNSFINMTLAANGTLITTASTVNVNNFTNTTLNTALGAITVGPRFNVTASTNVSTLKFNVSANRAFLNATNLTFLNTSATITLSGLSGPTNSPTVDFDDDGTFVACPADVCTIISDTGTTLTFNISHWTGFSSSSSGGVITNLTVSDETDGVVQYTGDTVEFFADYFNGSSGYDILGASCNASFGVDSTTQSMTYNVFIGAYKTTKLYGSAGTTNWNATCAASGFDTLTANDTVTITDIGVPEFSTWTLLIALAGVMIGFFVIRARRGI